MGPIDLSAKPRQVANTPTVLTRRPRVQRDRRIEPEALGAKLAYFSRGAGTVVGRGESRRSRLPPSAMHILPMSAAR
jgi:hypothetical protein